MRRDVSCDDHIVQVTGAARQAALVVARQLRQGRGDATPRYSTRQLARAVEVALLLWARGQARAIRHPIRGPGSMHRVRSNGSNHVDVGQKAKTRRVAGLVTTRELLTAGHTVTVHSDRRAWGDAICVVFNAAEAIGYIPVCRGAATEVSQRR